MTANLLLNSQEVRKLPAGSLFKAIFVVSALSQKSDKNGKPYYDVTVSIHSEASRRKSGRTPSGSISRSPSRKTTTTVCRSIKYCCLSERRSA